MTVLVLSGGGVWAAAGIGAAAALREMDVAVDAYVGSSAGALVGVLLALGHTPETLADVAQALKSSPVHPAWQAWAASLVRAKLPLGVASPARLWERLSGVLHDQDWADLGIPAWIVATSLSQRQAMVFGPGEPVRMDLGSRMHLGWGGTSLSLKTALRASTAVPGLLPPVSAQGQVLVDGGVVDDYPVDVAAWMGATYIIGVWVDEPPRWAPPRSGHLGHLAAASLSTMIRELSVVRQRQVAIPRVDIRIEMEHGHRVFNRMAEIVERGYHLTRDRAPEILAGQDRRA